VHAHATLLPPSSALRQAGSGLGGEDDSAHRAGSAAALTASFVLDLRPRGIRAVRDAVFLHGYAEPVLLVLHEVSPTWAGRLALRHDTCALAAFSLSLGQKRATRIWGDSSLPYDCSRLAAVPAPLGGALVLGTSFLLYRGQGAPPVSLALHPQSLGSAAVTADVAEDGRPLAPPTGSASVNPAPSVAAHATLSPLHTELDRACVAWPPTAGGPPTALVGTKTGALLALHMQLLGRNVAAMELRATAAPACVPSALAVLGSSLLFVGSRMGDSTLLECRHVAPMQPTLALEAPPPAKRARVDGEAAAAPSIVDEDELLYGAAEPAAAAAPPTAPHTDAADTPYAAAAAAAYTATGHGGPAGGSFVITPRDALPSIAPTVAFAVGETAVAGEPEPERSTRQELLLAVGQGPHGALVALHRGVAPDLVAAVPLPGVRGAWALHARRPAAAAAAAADAAAAPFHDYLLLSTRDATMVLDTSASEELQEVTDRVEFECGAPTLAAGTLFGGARIAQVHPGGVRVCAGAVKAQDMPLAAMAPTPPPGVSVVAADVCHPYVLLHLSDGSLRLLSGNPATNRLEALPPRASGRGLARDGFSAAALYDDTAGNGALAACLSGGGAAKAAPTQYVVATHSSGALELYALPAGTRVFSADGIAGGPQLLCGSPAAAAAAGGVDALPASSSVPPPPAVADVRLDTFPGAHDALLLTVARADGDVFAYRGFVAPVLTGPGAAAHAAPGELRFARYALDWTPSPGNAVSEHGAAPGRRLVRVSGVRGSVPVSGVFVTGTAPHWLLVSRGRVQAHPVSARGGGITAVTPFHNVNCPHGFICATSGAAGALRICTLPRGVDYSGAWPAVRARLGCTPVALAYAPEARCYAAVVAVRRAFVPRPVDDGDMHAATVATALASRAERAGGTEEAHELRLITPGSLSRAWTLEMEPGESVLALCPLSLRNAATGELRPVLALGTGFLGGEDAPCRGRCVLVDISWAPDARVPGGVARSGSVLHARPYKSAVTALSPLEGMHKGYILMTVGSKLGVHAWNGRDLTCIAFYDTPIYSVGLATVKNFLLLGDVQKGLFFLRWKDSPTEKVLEQLAKTFECVDFAAGDFLIDGSTLSLLGADTLGMLHVYVYTPATVESWDGKKLMPRGRFHSGRTTTRSARLRCTGASAATVVRSGVLLASMEGALAAVAPVDEGAFAPLRALADAMTLSLPHAAGLNPRAARAARERAGRVAKQPCAETLLDLPLLSRFLGLPWALQHELAERAGAPRDALVAAARAAAAESAWFV
jgi:cleavage and polyadenylation specificity factor subunit 1